MFNLENAIAEWRQQMLAAKISTLALDELENHFREEVERQIRSGANDQEAFEQTVLQIGHSRELKAEFAKDRNLLSLLGRDKFQAIDRIMGTLWLIFSFGGFVLTPRTIIRHVALEHYNLIFLSTMLIMWASYGIGVLGSILLIRRKKAGR